MTTHWTGYLALAVDAALGDRGAVWLAWRYTFARMLRRPAPIGIVRNGSVKRVYECAYCGASESMDARWKMPVRVYTWMRAHRAEHHTAMLADLWRGATGPAVEARHQGELRALRVQHQAEVERLTKNLVMAEEAYHETVEALRERVSRLVGPANVAGSRFAALDLDGGHKQ